MLGNKVGNVVVPIYPDLPPSAVDETLLATLNIFVNGIVETCDTKAVDPPRFTKPVVGIYPDVVFNVAVELNDIIKTPHLNASKTDASTYALFTASVGCVGVAKSTILNPSISISPSNLHPFNVKVSIGVIAHVPLFRI